jgi:hypothetical protein
LSAKKSRRPFGRGRRLLSAILAFAYVWAFVALGLTHTHAARRGPANHRSRGMAVAARPNGPVIGPAVVATDDGPCRVCTTMHASPVALTPPSIAAHLSLPLRRLPTWPTAYFPAPSRPASQPRAPPQA